MKIDVSEIKTFRTCKRKWKLTSRNAFHLRPIETPKAFHMGTLFHESLHKLYLGISLDTVMEYVRDEMYEDETALLAMIPQYADKVIPYDLERFKVLDIEHKFAFNPDGNPDITVCGSIDMIVVDKETNEVFGFEHKTAKNFRDSTFLWMDEQPRVYTYALMRYIDRLNKKAFKKWNDECKQSKDVPPLPPRYKLGGIYINEVKKLLRNFDYNRTLCVYPDDDLENFMKYFFRSCAACKHAVDTNDVSVPEPSYWNCQLCDFKSVCETYMYSTLNKERILKDFHDDVMEREVDHLDEK